MASNTAYRPVGIEEDMVHNSNRLSNCNGLFPQDYTDDGSAPRKPGRMIGVCSFSLIILGIGVVFLLGVCLGFYIRESQQQPEELCKPAEEPSIDYDKLGGYHDAFVYFIRGQEIRKFVDEFGTDDPLTGSAAEQRLEDAVLEEFNLHRIDTVEVEEHQIVVTSPDPSRPNRLQVLHTNGTLAQTFDLTNQRQADNSRNTTGKDQDETDGAADNWWKFPHVSFCPPGRSRASLVYGHYGLKSDLDILESLGVQVRGKTVLMRLGQTSVADKLIEVERHGAVSALFYWEDSDHQVQAGVPVDPKTVPYASAATYVQDSPGLWTPSIPCQTISTQQAHTLITLLVADLGPRTSDDFDDVDNVDTNNNNGTQLLLSFPDMYIGRETTKGSFSVRLSLFNKARRQTIRNIITSIQGTEETDHYTIVGSPRSWLPGGHSQDVVVSTSILVQLARSSKRVHQLHQWKPRRGVKFISWGGAEFSNAGSLLYIKNRQHLLDRRVMAYLDLGQLVTGNESIAVHASGSLNQLVKEVAFDILDPRDGEQTIQSRWLEKKGNTSLAIYSPLHGYGTDNTLSPFLHLVGAPTIKAQFQGRLGNKNMSVLQRYSYKHHYKYHIATVHILVMSLMSLLDNQLVPINTWNMAQELDTTVWQTSAILEQCTDDRAHLYKTLKVCKSFVRAAEAFEDLAQVFVKRSDRKGIDMVNKIKMMMEHLFVVRHQGSSHHILYPMALDGSIQQASDLCDVWTASKTLQPMAQFGRLLEQIIHEADLALRIAA